MRAPQGPRKDPARTPQGPRKDPQGPRKDPARTPQGPHKDPARTLQRCYSRLEFTMSCNLLLVGFNTWDELERSKPLKN